MQEATRISCPHGRECGACRLLEIDRKVQLRQKQEAVERALRDHPRLRGIRPVQCLPSPLFEGYRNRAKMAVGISRHSGVHLGYFKSGTREIVDAHECRVLVPELLETTRRLRRWLEGSRRIPRELRHIDLRCGSDPSRQHLTLVVRAEEAPGLPIDEITRSCPEIDGISINLNPTAGPQVIRGPVQPLWGEREVWVDHAGLRLRISPAAFFQVNLSVLPELHRQMGSFFDRGQLLADLYAGVGTHGLSLRGRFRRLLFVEGHRSAVADLKSTIQSEKLADCEVVGVAVERGLDALRRARPDAVVLNPSRAGAHPAVLDTIASAPTSKLAYLSCDPATLCRDLEILHTKGFRIRSLQPIDMMPQTAQVEVLAFLTRERQRR